MKDKNKQKLIDYINTVDGLQVLHITSVLVEDAKTQLYLEDKIREAYKDKFISAEYVLHHYRTLVEALGGD